jgi:hypothetical protein
MRIAADAGIAPAIRYVDETARIAVIDFVERDYPDIVGRLDAHTEHLSRIRENYVWDAKDSVSSHNDAIPGNILFDGRRLWLIDWESAYRNDPLVDVATMLDNLAPSLELENALLGAWSGRGDDESLLTRLTLVRTLTRLYYAGVFLSASAATPRATPDDNLSAPSLPEFRRAIQDGLHNVGAPETKHILGKMFLASFIGNAAPPGFDAAV